MTGTPSETKPGHEGSNEHETHQVPAADIGSTSSTSGALPTEEDKKKWGTHVMGVPAVPTVHPDNQKAALWTAGDYQQNQNQPYVLYTPVEKPAHNPLESVVQMFHTWSSKTETVARNIWHNLKAGPSVSEAAWGKVNLASKALTGGGFEPLFKQIFMADSSEKLKKTFACYLSTTTGPVAGTIYLSNARVAFCSDRPLSFTAPSGQETWSYYKVSIPLGNVGTVNPVILKDNPPEKYIQIVTIDGHDFWFMGFVNFDKAAHHLQTSVAEFRSMPYFPPQAQAPAPATNQTIA